MTTGVDGNTLSVTVANTNEDPTTSCGAFALDATKLPALQADPSKITEPGFLAWQTDVAERVGAGAEDTFTTDLQDGVYAVVGECISLTNPELPAVGDPQIVPVGGLLAASTSAACRACCRPTSTWVASRICSPPISAICSRVCPSAPRPRLSNAAFRASLGGADT